MKARTGIIVLVALATAVTGCGGGGGQPRSSKPPGAKQASAGGQRLTQVTLPETAGELAALVQQQTQTSQTVRITATTASEGDSGKSSIEISGALVKPVNQQPAATLKVVEVGGKEAGTTHVMVGGGAIYAQVEGDPYALGKPWLRVTREELATPGLDDNVKASYEEALGLAQQAVQQSSSDLGVSVLAQGKLLRNPEWEKLGGMDVRRYSGTTDTTALSGATKDPRLQLMEAGGFREYPWTVWVDKYGLPRQFTSTIIIPKAGTITSRAIYQAWGQPITITFPSPTEIATLDQ